jgi:hypothetical protein
MGNFVPGRNGIGPGVANPCGSLSSCKYNARYRIPRWQFLYRRNRRLGSLTVLLDLVVVLDRLADNIVVSEESDKHRLELTFGGLNSPLCLIAIKSGDVEVLRTGCDQEKFHQDWKQNSPSAQKALCG